MRKALVLAVAGVLLLAIAGPALAGTVTPADVDLRFRTQIENDFEVRDNYTFDNDVDELADTRNGWFVESEIRIGFDGKAGNWMTHVLLEWENLWDRDNEGNNVTIALERAWADYNFGPFHLRAGPAEAFVLDPAQIVYQDDDPMARLWGNYNDIGWTIGWMRRQDDGAATNRVHDHDVFFGNAAIPIGTGAGKITLTPFVMYSRDNQNADVTSATRRALIEEWWIGGALQGPVGPVQVLAEFVYLTGDDEGSGSNTTALDGETDIKAWMGLLDVAWPIPNTPITLEFVGVWASGDDDPTDGDAEGYGAIAQDTEIGNPDGIWLDDRVDVFDAGATPARVRLTFDDRYTPAFAGAAGVADGTAGIATLAANATEHRVLSHPGIQFYALLVHYKATPELTVTGLWNHVRTFEDVDNVSDTGGAGTGREAKAGAIGNELGIRAVWKPEKYVTFTPQISVFLPGDVVDDIVDQTDTAVNGYLEMLVSF